MTSTPTERSPRVRDPDRKQKILESAVALVADRGYHAVSLAEIGADAGIVGSGVYRHFESKSAILVELFERVIDGLRQRERLIVEQEPEVWEALRRLIDDQVDFVVADRQVAQVYHLEVGNLPEDDRRRLRRKQRLYLEDWVHTLHEARPDLDDARARTLVHCAIGAIQSALFHNLGMPEQRLREMLRDAAIAVLRS